MMLWDHDRPCKPPNYQLCRLPQIGTREALVPQPPNRGSEQSTAPLDAPKPENQRSLFIFLDNDDMMEVPCGHSLDDRMLMHHIGEFYFLKRAERGIVEACAVKDFEQVEIIEVCQKQN